MITNAKLILPSDIIEAGTVVIRGDRIAACGPAAEVAIPDGATIYDAEGFYAGPGFIDIHLHGGGGYMAHEHPLEVAKAHLPYGTTGMLPTPSYSQDRDALRAGVRAITDAMEGDDPYRRLILGFHLEGPYLNPAHGPVTWKSNMRPVDPEEYRELLAMAGTNLKIWTIAPEMPGQSAFVDEVRTSCPDIVFSAGHSACDPETLYRFVPKGLRLACHCMCASGTTPVQTRFRGTREVGLDEAVLVHDGMTAEVIPDRGGVHVRPLLLKLIVKAKGVDNVIIITDAVRMAATGELFHRTDVPALAGFPDSDDVNINPNGGLSGSLLTMDRAVRNMMLHTGVDMVDAFRMASLNPARMLKMDGDYGSLAPGKKANLVVVDEQVRIRDVFFEGEPVRRERGGVQSVQ